jgi:hypothetical protein
MTSLLSSISGQFGKSIFLGAMFPVLIVALLNSLFTVPLLSSAEVLQTHLQQIASGKETWGALLLLSVLIFSTGVLYNLNLPILRLYEGYPWKDSWIGKLLTYPKKKAFAQASPLRLSLRYLRRQLQAVDASDPRIRVLQNEQNALAIYIYSDLPDREDLVLPTRFGNVVRCFERYSEIAYGIESAIAWPRLIAKIEPGFAATIDEAKTSVDFMINCSLLCALSGLAVIGIGLFQPPVWSAYLLRPCGWRAALFLALASTFYSFAIGRARAWGGR